MCVKWKGIESYLRKSWLFANLYMDKLDISLNFNECLESSYKNSHYFIVLSFTKRTKSQKRSVSIVKRENVGLDYQKYIAMLEVTVAGIKEVLLLKEIKQKKGHIDQQ